MPQLVQANGEDAEVAARNAEEQELALNLEMGQDNEWEDDFSKSDFERTRPPVNMLNKSRNVSDSFEKLNRISEGTYGVVYRWVQSPAPALLMYNTPDHTKLSQRGLKGSAGLLDGYLPKLKGKKPDLLC